MNTDFGKRMMLFHTNTVKLDYLRCLFNVNGRSRNTSMESLMALFLSSCTILEILLLCGQTTWQDQILSQPHHLYTTHIFLLQTTSFRILESFNFFFLPLQQDLVRINDAYNNLQIYIFKRDNLLLPHHLHNDNVLAFIDPRLLSHIMRNPTFFANAKTKGQISCTVTVQLISAFVFSPKIHIVQSLYFLKPKFQASIHLLLLYSPVCVNPDQKESRQFTDKTTHRHAF